jgi:hypothetical protein
MRVLPGAEGRNGVVMNTGLVEADSVATEANLLIPYD